MNRYKMSQIKGVPYWCTHCDRTQVTDETGTYYGQFGHTSETSKAGVYELGSGDYTQLVFAVCNQCKPDFFSVEITK